MIMEYTCIYPYPLANVNMFVSELFAYTYLLHKGELWIIFTCSLLLSAVLMYMFTSWCLLIFPRCAREPRVDLE